MTNPMKPELLQVIAEQVVSGTSEQYLYVTSVGMTAMFTTPQIADAINTSLAQWNGDGVQAIVYEFNTSPAIQSPIRFNDGATAVIDVGGVLVELSVRKLAPAAYRILFSRVNAMTLYGGLSARVDALEARLGAQTTS
jgi:hypothetical protein